MTHQPAISPNPEQIASIASSARVWLGSLLERIPATGDVAVRALCHVLIASWIADTMAGTDGVEPAGFTEVAQHVARSLNATENGDYIGAVKPTLKLLAEVLLSSQGLRVIPLRQFFTLSTSILRRADPALQADPSLMDKRIILHSAGVLPGLPSTSADGVRVLLDKFRLSASADVIDALTLQLECLTGWGTQLVDTGLIAPSIGEILTGFAVYHLRNYDLPAAARLLRVEEYLASSHVVARRDDLYCVLCAHRRIDGPFGWYGPETAKLRKQNPTLLADLEFHLPTTLECLWTLAERSLDGWRLFGNLPAYALENGKGSVANVS